MKASISRLIAAAATAKPKPHHRAKYDDLVPVVVELVKGGFTVQDAVEWLHAKKAPGVTKKNIPLIAGAMRRRFQRAAKASNPTNTKQQ